MTPRTGAVTAFDDPRGIGIIADGDGVEFPFHCTALTDGTRYVEVGASVRFGDRPGRQGKWEATEIVVI